MAQCLLPTAYSILCSNGAHDKIYLHNPIFDTLNLDQFYLFDLKLKFVPYPIIIRTSSSETLHGMEQIDVK